MNPNTYGEEARAALAGKLNPKSEVQPGNQAECSTPPPPSELEIFRMVNRIRSSVGSQRELLTQLFERLGPVLSQAIPEGGNVASAIPAYTDFGKVLEEIEFDIVRHNNGLGDVLYRLQL